MKIAILDDWFDTLRTLPCFETLAGHEVTVFTDHIQDTDAVRQGQVVLLDLFNPHSQQGVHASGCSS
jgi:hypothetical protein